MRMCRDGEEWEWREPERYGQGYGCAAAPLHGAPGSAGRAYEAAAWLHGLLWPRFYVAPSRGSGWPTRRRGDEGEWVGGHAASVRRARGRVAPFTSRSSCRRREPQSVRSCE